MPASYPGCVHRTPDQNTVVLVTASPVGVAPVTSVCGHVRQMGGNCCCCCCCCCGCCCSSAWALVALGPSSPSAAASGAAPHPAAKVSASTPALHQPPILMHESLHRIDRIGPMFD